MRDLFRRILAPLLTFTLVLTAAACSPAQESGDAGGETADESADSAESDTYFVASGDEEVTVDPAEASLDTNRIGIWVLTLAPPIRERRNYDKSYSARLFFSRQFDAAPGTYPIQFSYLSNPNTLGGSFNGHRYSHDTAGQAEFLEVGDQVKVRFEFTAYSASEGSEDRKEVTVKGEAVVDRGGFP